MKKVLIIQPCIPEYRLYFFDKLQKSANLDISLASSLVDPFTGVKTCKSALERQYVLPVCSFFSFKIKLFNREDILSWQNVKAKIADYDVVVIHGNPKQISNYYIVLKAKILNKSVIWWGQGWSYTSTNSRARFRRTITKLCSDKVLLYTEIERDDYLEYGFKANKVFAINNGIDLDMIDSAINKAKKEIPAKVVNVKKNSINVVFIGRLLEKSKLSLLLEALSLLPENIVLHVIGDGPDRPMFTSLAKKLGLTSRIIFYGKVYCEDEIAKIILKTDFLVFPGAVGLSLLHAFAYSRPAIIHDQRQLHGPECVALENYKNGITFEEGGVNDLCSAITEMIGIEDLSVLGKHARRSIETRYNTQEMVKSFRATLDMDAY